jgi:hypothetical protein
VGGFVSVGERLHLTPSGVEFHVRNAQRKRDTPEGLREYHEWLTHREHRWWIYHAICVEKIELKPLEYVGKVEGDRLILVNTHDADLHLRREEIDAFLEKAEHLLKTERGKHDYKAWLAVYERRDEKARTKPLMYRSEPSDSQIAQAFSEKRAGKGLRNGLTARGRKRNKLD